MDLQCLHSHSPQLYSIVKNESIQLQRQNSKIMFKLRKALWGKRLLQHQGRLPSGRIMHQPHRGCWLGYTHRNMMVEEFWPTIFKEGNIHPSSHFTFYYLICYTVNSAHLKSRKNETYPCCALTGYILEEISDTNRLRERSTLIPEVQRHANICD